jgi:hydroxymethylpyrimidine pyrophosphatase-like HAD family hydrolase
MKYTALATDYDGTIAHHGMVDEQTLAALRRARDAGIQLLLVTGRRLQDIVSVMPQYRVFHRIVGENGAVVFDPATEESKTLAAAPPEEFLARLNATGMPLYVGHTVVATVKPHDADIALAITDLNMDWHLIFNKDDVMALPAGVSKASGLRAALLDLKIAPEQIAAVGDAENDLEMLAIAAFPVAVDNALPTLKQAAAWVTPAPRGEGVAQLIERMLLENR